MEHRSALWAGVAALAAFIIALPAWGVLSDRVGRRPVLLVSYIVLKVVCWPLMNFISPHPLTLVVSMGTALVVLAAIAALMPAVYAELFPTSIRAIGMGVPYSVCVALFGGTAPYLQLWFASRDFSAGFAIYSIAALVVGALTVLKIKETRGLHL